MQFCLTGNLFAKSTKERVFCLQDPVPWHESEDIGNMKGSVSLKNLHIQTSKGLKKMQLRC